MKQEVYKLSLQALEDRLAALNKALEDAQDAANQETKSSAGDKHETGRAMMQLETEKLYEQIARAKDELNRLSRLNPENENKVVGEGALVITDKMNLYFSVSAGTFRVGEYDIITLSLASGLGVAARGCEAGDSFSFRGQSYKIISIS